jgi:hypothetical protein
LCDLGLVVSEALLLTNALPCHFLPALKNSEYKVTVRFAARANLYHLQQFLSGRQRDCPQDTIQALDVVLRESPCQKYDIIVNLTSVIFFTANSDNVLTISRNCTAMSLFLDPSSRQRLAMATSVMASSIGEGFTRVCGPRRWACH